MSDQNAHLLSEIDGVEYEIEVIGDEVVGFNFTAMEQNFYEVFSGKEPLENLTLMKPRTPLFSFAATPELKALVFEANEWFDRHGEDANDAMDARIQALAEPEIRKALTNKYYERI